MEAKSEIWEEIFFKDSFVSSQFTFRCFYHADRGWALMLPSAVLIRGRLVHCHLFLNCLWLLVDLVFKKVERQRFRRWNKKIKKIDCTVYVNQNSESQLFGSRNGLPLLCCPKNCQKTLLFFFLSLNNLPPLSLSFLCFSCFYLIRFNSILF